MSDLPTPITRKEQFLNSIARGNTSDLPTPITREEEYLDAIAKSGGGSGDGDMKKSVYDSDLAVANAGGIGAFVSDAVDEVNSKSWSLGAGASIANNTDLNDITTVGNYYATTAAAATLSHCPITGGFKLKVLYDVRESASTYIEQVFNPVSSYDEYRRYKSGSAKWSDWHLTNCNLDEVKGKVADNTGAIEAIVNEYGAKNLYNYTYLTTQTFSDLTVTVNADKSISIVGTNNSGSEKVFYTNSVAFDIPAGSYIINGGLDASIENDIRVLFFHGDIHEVIHDEDVPYTFNSTVGCNFTIHVANGATVNATIKPMLRDARITDPTYVPFAMTNRELTDIKANNDIVSDAYSESATYAVGDYCIYNNVLYRCNTAIATGEAFAPAKWTATTVGREVSAVNSSLLIEDVTSDFIPAAANWEIQPSYIAYKQGKTITFIIQSGKLASESRAATLFTFPMAYKPKFTLFFQTVLIAGGEHGSAGELRVDREEYVIKTNNNQEFNALQHWTATLTWFID